MRFPFFRILLLPATLSSLHGSQANAATPLAQDPATQIQIAEPGRPIPAPEAEAAGDPRPHSYYVRARGYRVVPESDPPRYVRDAAETGYPLLSQAPWLDIGLENRTRFEYRENSFLRTPQAGSDYPFLLRTRLYLGVKDVLDPFRLAIEFQDSQWANSIYPNTNREVNEREPIQMYGELHFENALGAGRPFYIRGGRMAFELVDRRLVANNEFRNTTNNFQGVRIHAGKQTQDWELDLLALQPIDRLLYDFDEAFDARWFYGATASIRRWSDVATIQPYWFGLKQGLTDGLTEDETVDIQTTGVRGYGVSEATGWDWDAGVVYQFGEALNEKTQNAWASELEIGYTVAPWSWKPRFSGFFAYGSGDRNPDDDQNNNFNSLFGFNQPWSRNDYFSWDNAIQPKLRIEATPLPDLLLDVGFGAFWLASAKAPWQRAELSNPTGRSGSWLGTEYDIRLRYRLWGHVSLETSYSRFNPGTFPKDLGKGLPSNFFFFAVSLSPFE